jgi:NAD(P) transhydrogenase subunit alpha
MIFVAVPAEEGGERRVALTPETAKKFIAKGCEVAIERSAGLASGYADGDYEAVGARVSGDINADLGRADLVLAINCPSPERIRAVRKGALLAAALNPFDHKERMQELANAGISAFAMEFMPRITRAQSMDILSSQSNLAGYKAVIDAASTFGRAMPMMMTAAGTVPAAKAFIMGVGVAGLQAIATARRLGAIVSATDVRPATKEQVESLGAKFIAVEDEEFKAAETSGGYAKEMSAEYKAKQAALVASHIAKQDIVITTALIPGKPAPKLISKDMVESMPRGAVIVDLAAERGGNCELTEPGEVINHNGVTIMGRYNLAGELSGNASALFARNLLAFLSPMLDDKEKALKVNWQDELVTGTLICRDGAIVHPRLVGEGGK